MRPGALTLREVFQLGHGTLNVECLFVSIGSGILEFEDKYDSFRGTLTLVLVGQWAGRCVLRRT